MFIREAKLTDTDAMSRTMIASITELSVADHGSDPGIVARWIANKTPMEIKRWLDGRTGRYFVADDAGQVVGVGALHDDEVLLNHVAPVARFRGVSKAMLAHLEVAMHESGVRLGKLTSTATALRFYLSSGWVDQGGAEPMFGAASGRLMTKSLG
jgi:hypothetical protein